MENLFPMSTTVNILGFYMTVKTDLMVSIKVMKFTSIFYKIRQYVNAKV